MLIYVSDRRECYKIEEAQEITIDDSSEDPHATYDDFLKELKSTFHIDEKNQSFVIATTGRNIITNESFARLVKEKDTVLLLTDIHQQLDKPVKEYVDYVPHYDTIVKSGMYEYYASEGHINPLPYAFAELIDNSLAATKNNKGERLIHIHVYYDDKHKNHTIEVLDNGKGMSAKQLNNWAIYRLSKFNREERDLPNSHVNIKAEQPTSGYETSSRKGKTRSSHRGDKDERERAQFKAEQKCLNSDISWFGVGGKQAVFFIGNTTRVITKIAPSKDVHEFRMSSEEFKRKERENKDIFTGHIVNRKTKDSSHLPPEEKFTRMMIEDEDEMKSFTRIVITDVKPEHIKFLKDNFMGWVKQLALVFTDNFMGCVKQMTHIYHYYIHGSDGNTVLTSKRANPDQLDVKIRVSLWEHGIETKSKLLSEVTDDLQSRYIRSSSEFDFEFKFISHDRQHQCNGIIRYHPFLYDSETNPQLDYVNHGNEEDDSNTTVARNARSIFECFWNGRLIPYTYLDTFDWCKPRQRFCHTAYQNLTMEVYNRITGIIFTSDMFKVSTNKLTFVDLDSKVRESNGNFYRQVMGDVDKTNKIEKSFLEWLKICNERYDKQIMFMGFDKIATRTINGKSTKCSFFRKIKVSEKHEFEIGQKVRTTRTNPIVIGKVVSFFMEGQEKSERYGTKGFVEIMQVQTHMFYNFNGTKGFVEIMQVQTHMFYNFNGTKGFVEIMQEPASIYGQVKLYSLNKIDKNCSSGEIAKYVKKEEDRLPHRLKVTWPEGHQIVDGKISQDPVHIGAMHIKILNRLNQPVDKLPGAAIGKKKLKVKQELVQINDKGKRNVITSYECGKGKSYDFYFKRNDAARDPGNYEIVLQVTREDGNEQLEETQLPKLVIKFSIDAPGDDPHKFTFGMLSNLRMGTPFDLRLNMIASNGQPARIPSEWRKIKPKISAKSNQENYMNRKLEFENTDDVEVRSSSIVIKGLVAKGETQSIFGTNFNLKVAIANLDAQTIATRIMPGEPTKIGLLAMNARTFNKVQTGEVSNKLEYNRLLEMKLCLLDCYNNVTHRDNLEATCCFTTDYYRWSVDGENCDFSESGGSGTLRMKLKKKKDKEEGSGKGSSKELKGRVYIEDNNQIKFLYLNLKFEASSRVQHIVVKHNRDGKEVSIKNGGTIKCPAGSMLSGLRVIGIDEGKRELPCGKKIGNSLNVNWSAGNQNIELFRQGKLPDVKVPKQVSEVKHCQVSLHGTNKAINFNFDVKPTAGPLAAIKVHHGIKQCELGQVCWEPISVELQDRHGNQVRACEVDMQAVILEGREGIDYSGMRKSLSKDGKITFKGLAFLQGEVGNVQMEACYPFVGGRDNLVDKFTVKLASGQPCSVRVIGWNDNGQTPGDEFLTIESGRRMTEPIRIQLYDAWGNPCMNKGVTVRLGTDPMLKLTPAAMETKTDGNGVATFQLFTVSAKCGRYKIYPNALYDRQTIAGDDLPVIVNPNCSIATKIVVTTNHDQYVVRKELEGIEVSLLSDEDTRVNNKTFVAMWLWPGNDENYKQKKTTKHVKECDNGLVNFNDFIAPTTAGSYTAVFCMLSKYNQRTPDLLSKYIHFKLIPDKPYSLHPAVKPGTLTVSNSEDVDLRTIVKDLTIKVTDFHENTTELRDENGNEIEAVVGVQIMPSEEQDQENKQNGEHVNGDSIDLTKEFDFLPKFDGVDGQEIEFPMRSNGLSDPQTLIMQANQSSPDGMQFQLMFSLNNCPQYNVKPYSVDFRFFNDAEKQAEIKKIAKDRDELKEKILSFRTNHGRLKDEMTEFERLKGKTKKKKSQIMEKLAMHHFPQDVATEIRETREELAEVANVSLRKCETPNYTENDGDVLGKICHLVKIEDDRACRLISWHMAGDMDCIVTRTIDKSKEVCRKFHNNKMVIPLENIRKKKDLWDKQLPRTDNNFHRAEPKYARSFLTFEHYEEEMKNVFKMFLGDTVICRDLDSANEYRKQVIKYAVCPTILTLDGHRIKSSGKFGGKQNQLPDKLRCVFGQPESSHIKKLKLKIELLQQYEEEKSKMNAQNEIVKEKLQDMISKGCNPQDTAGYKAQKKLHDDMTQLLEKKMRELRRENGSTEKRPSKRTSVEAGLDLNNITTKARRRTTRNK